MIAPGLYHQTIARLTAEYPLVGMAMLRHRNGRSSPISFRDQPYLVEWYADFHPATNIDGADIVSIPQCGKTELFIQMQLYEAGWLGRLTAYAMPVSTARDGLVKMRINPLLTDVPAYRERLPAKDLQALQRGETSSNTGSMRSKRFGNGSMLFITAKTDTDWVDYSVDTMIIDEYDHCAMDSPLNISKAPDRLRASPRPRIYRSGNPEVPRAGIELLWSEGDQRLYHWRCGHCGERQPLTWLDSIVDRDDSGAWVLRDREAMEDPQRPIRPVCRRCRQPFEREQAGSAWVALAHERKRRSYRVTRYDNLGTPLRVGWEEWLQAQASTTLLRAWWRGWEGVAWEPSSGGIARDDLRSAACLGPMDHVGGDQYKGQAMTAGIDVGSLFNVTVSRTVRGLKGRSERRAVWVGTVRSPEQVHEILRRYHVRTAVIDAMPETRVAQSIRDDALRHYGCDVWLCRFAPADRAGAEEYGMRLQSYERTVLVDRTQLLDAGSDHVRLGGTAGRTYAAASLTPPPWVDRRAEPREVAGTWALLESLPDPGGERARLWPSDVMDVTGFVDQMQAPRRVMTPEGTVRWVEAGKPDHYRLADSYDLLAMTIDSQGAQLL